MRQTSIATLLQWRYALGGLIAGGALWFIAHWYLVGYDTSTGEQVYPLGSAAQLLVALLGIALFVVGFALTVPLAVMSIRRFSRSQPDAVRPILVPGALLLGSIGMLVLATQLAPDCGPSRGSDWPSVILLFTAWSLAAVSSVWAFVVAVRSRTGSAIGLAAGLTLLGVCQIGMVLVGFLALAFGCSPT